LRPIKKRGREIGKHCVSPRKGKHVVEKMWIGNYPSHLREGGPRGGTKHKHWGNCISSGK